MERKRILIFPAGAENALEIYQSLRYNVNVEVFGLSGKKDFAEYQYDSEHYIEGDFYVFSEGFAEKFQAILSKHRIDVVIPTHDDVALYLAQHRECFSARVLVSSAETAYICRHKKVTYNTFKDESFCPAFFEDIDLIRNEDYPLFVKPDIGVGGRDAYKVSEKSDLPGSDEIANYAISEYLPGTELTVDCFTKQNGALAFCGARTRDRIAMGIAFRSTSIPMTEEIRYIAETINERLSFLGAWYFQVRQDCHGVYKLMEISCRQAGTMSLYRHKGINFPLLGIFELYGIDTSFVELPGQIQLERCLHTVFKTEIIYDTVFIDYDDTLIVRGKVCDITIRFLYQCVNENKRIVLLTRHDENLDESLEKHHLCQSLFDEIIVLDFSKEKKDFINPDKAIFIDNSFQERKAVHDCWGIPVFDVDTIDVLMRE